MKVEKISSKLIKPHIPTPKNLKNYKISCIDKHVGKMNFAVVLFYESKKVDYIQLLEQSLAKILVDFYPLAGRFIKNDDLIDCSDEGVEFVEAEAQNDVVSRIKIDHDELNNLLPDNHFRVDEAAKNPLLSIQITHLPSCGGLAVAVSVSHRVFDASSLWTFVAAWSSYHRTKGPHYCQDRPYASFHLHSLLPCKDHNSVPSRSIRSGVEDRKIIVVKRLSFNKAALTSLKSRVTPKKGGKGAISGARAASAAIAKALIRLDRVRRESRAFRVLQSVNMRERTIPPQPKHSCGNFAILTATRRVDASEAEGVGLHELVHLLGDAVRNGITDHAQRLSTDTILSNLDRLYKQMGTPETNVIVLTDWSRFRFDEADFGWGKPVSTSIGLHQASSNIVVLMSNKEGDGIEAWLHLNQNDVHYFEQDEEIRDLITS